MRGPGSDRGQGAGHHHYRGGDPEVPEEVPEAAEAEVPEAAEAVVPEGELPRPREAGSENLVRREGELTRKTKKRISNDRESSGQEPEKKKSSACRKVCLSVCKRGEQTAEIRQ